MEKDTKKAILDASMEVVKLLNGQIDSNKIQEMIANQPVPVYEQVIENQNIDNISQQEHIKNLIQEGAKKQIEQADTLQSARDIDNDLKKNSNEVKIEPKRPTPKQENTSSEVKTEPKRPTPKEENKANEVKTEPKRPTPKHESETEKKEEDKKQSYNQSTYSKGHGY